MVGTYPIIYLDGYIDQYGASESSLKTALNNLEEGIVDTDVCEKLRWLFGLCKNSDTSENKCKDGTVSSSAVPS